MIHFTISGSVPSKKNSRVLTFGKSRPYSFPSKLYRRWWEESSTELMVQKIPPVNVTKMVTMIFYSSSLRGADLDNKAASVLDVMKDRNIIPDDNWSIVPRLLLIYGGLDRENPRVEVEIEV